MQARPAAAAAAITTGPAAAARRRRLLVAAAAGAATALAGCAGVGSGAGARARVVVVGGGYGGATAARFLRLQGGDRLDVTLVEREEAFVSCPMSNRVVAGLSPMAAITHAYAGLESLGVKRVQGEAVAIDPVARQLRLADGRVLRWDRLVLAPGVDFMTDEVGGLAGALASGRVLHAWKAGAQTAALRAQLEALPAGGVFALCIPPVPYRCPPAPYERACLVAAWMARHRPRGKVLVLDANPEIQSKKALFERAFREHPVGRLEYRPNNALQAVEDGPAGLVARLEFDDVRADVLNVVPPQRGGDIARQAGLLDINGRWAGVDWLTMESRGAPGIHVVGDTVFPAPVMPKSGQIAFGQGRLAAAAIVRLLQGGAVDPEPVLTSVCYSFVTATEAAHIRSEHRYDAAEKTFKAVPASADVSAAASVADGRAALAWSDDIRRAMLGP